LPGPGLEIGRKVGRMEHGDHWIGPLSWGNDHYAAPREGWVNGLGPTLTR
jgi:hypothetical protein